MSQAAPQAIDFRALVDRAARRVEHADQVIVEEDARELLVRRALDHEADVYAALSREGLGEKDLEDAAVAQLREAVPRRPAGGGLVGILSTPNSLLGHPPDMPRIDALALTEGMNGKCHWVGWC